MCASRRTARLAARDIDRTPWAAPFLGAKAVHRAREGDCLTDVAKPADPADGALESEAEARVHEGPVLSQVEVPVVRLDGKRFLLDARQQLVGIPLALGPADYLAVSFGRQQIVAQ